MTDPINDIPNTPIQLLLDNEARLGNDGFQTESDIVKEEIRQVRGNNPPMCFGNDDCSTLLLIQCPWRFDCGK